MKPHDRGGLPLPADIDRRIFSAHKHSLHRLGHLQNGTRRRWVACPVRVGGVEMELPNRSDPVAVQN